MTAWRYKWSKRAVSSGEFFMAYGSLTMIISGAILWNPVIFFPAVILTYLLTLLSGFVCDFIGWAFDRPDPNPPAGERRGSE